ncbi:hypothetical protein SNEBB_000539 [Seison nebaliae]|nr:hypothetical protein SNEBB_000539 [Seison nebaliae]
MNLKKLAINSFRSISSTLGESKNKSELRKLVKYFANVELSEKRVKEAEKKNNLKNFRYLFRRLGSMGLLGPTADHKYGGASFGYEEHCIICEELSRRSGAFSLSYGAHSNLCINQLIRNGNEKQKEKYLPKLCSGEFVGALAMSESDSGSDVVSMKLTAKKKSNSDKYILNGSKYWITNGNDADIFIIYCRTDDDEMGTEKLSNSHRITTFLVERNLNGFSLSKKFDKLGMRGSNTCELILDNVEVDEENILGKKLKGVYILMSGLDFERLVLSAAALGQMEEIFKIFKKSFSNQQFMRYELFKIYARINACRSYLYTVVRSVDRGVYSPIECTSIILHLAEECVSITNHLLSFTNLENCERFDEINRIWRDSKLATIGAGTTQVREGLVGRLINNQYS